MADASKGISILGGLTGVNINLSDLLSVINAYVPYIQYAGVKSDDGFTVTAKKLTEDTTWAAQALRRLCQWRTDFVFRRHQAETHHRHGSG